MVVSSTLFSYKTFYAESTDLLNGYKAGRWYGIVTYNNITTKSDPQPTEYAANAAALKIISDLSITIPPPVPPSPPPLIQFPIINICAGDIFPRLNNNVSGSNIVWYIGDSTIGSSIPPTMVDTTHPGTYTYWVTQNTNGAESEKVSMMVIINQVPKLVYAGPLHHEDYLSINLAASTYDLNCTGADITFWLDALFSIPVPDPYNFTDCGKIWIQCINNAGCRNVLIIEIAIHPITIIRASTEYEFNTSEPPSLSHPYRFTIKDDGTSINKYPLLDTYINPLYIEYESFDELIASATPNTYIIPSFITPKDRAFPLVISITRPEIAKEILVWLDVSGFPSTLMFVDDQGNLAYHGPVVLLDASSQSIIDYIDVKVDTEFISSTSSDATIRLTYTPPTVNSIRISPYLEAFLVTSTDFLTSYPTSADPDDPLNPNKAIITLSPGYYAITSVYVCQIDGSYIAPGGGFFGVGGVAFDSYTIKIG